MLGARLGATLVESSDPLWTPDTDLEPMTVDYRTALARLIPMSSDPRQLEWAEQIADAYVEIVAEATLGETIMQAMMLRRTGLIQRGRGPTLYPVACSPQAWASATPFSLMKSAGRIASVGRSRSCSRLRRSNSGRSISGWPSSSSRSIAW